MKRTMKSVSLTRPQDKALGRAIKSLDHVDFPQALSHFVSKVVEFDNLILIVYYKNHNPRVVYREYKDPRVYRDMDSNYVKAAYLLDPFYQAALDGLQSGVHQIFDLAPDQFKKTSYFLEYYRDTTLVDEFAVFARLGHNTTLTACFGRDHTSNTPFSRQELAAVRNYEHILTALCEQYWKEYVPEEGVGVTLPPVTDRLRTELVNQHNISLSPRQAEVALYILQGHSSLSISLNLDISKETVKVFRKQLYAKCNISSQAELFALLMPIFSIL